MKYSELIQFEPLETIVELKEANKEAGAKHLVETFVISRQMSQWLCDTVMPILRFDQSSEDVERLGIFIVGNYGTGKSHLMSLISAVAEREELVSCIQEENVRSAAAGIAGKYKVVRIEIGASKMTLRDIITRELEEHLSGMGIKFEFPPADKVISNKTDLEDMMSAFHKKYPEHGLFIVVDELLDYLGTRKDMELRYDLSMLRELGEASKNLRFRFIAGIQEALFDNPTFNFVAKDILRVKDRFVQRHIARADVKFVVSERLLKKTVEQREMIQKHLESFVKFYGEMGGRIDEFVRLYPVHPDYIEMFENLRIIEKRQVLKTLTQEMQERINNDVPDDNPGLIAFDSYWKRISDDPGFRSISQVQDVMDCSRLLEGIIETSFGKELYKPMALRIINALSIHRLSVGDIYSPLGMGARELRDQLCLLQPGIEELGGDPADDLATIVETVLREISKTVSGQFLSYNEGNEQWHLDLKKTRDYDAEIDKRTETLEDSVLDRYYFEALRRVMECSDQKAYVSGYKIWEHELEWTDRRVGRQGYLFFGTPNERSTAVPPRDFYLYFLPPIEPAPFTDEKKADEVFFKLAVLDEEFMQTLKRYAAALDMAAKESGEPQNRFTAKSDDSLKKLVAWLQENMSTSFEVTSQGKSKKLHNWLGGKGVGHSGMNVRDLVNTVGSACLAKKFEDDAPEYPTFSIHMTLQNREQAVGDALLNIGNIGSADLGTPAKITLQGTQVLDALQLLDGDRLDPSRSKYAQYIVDKLKKKGEKKVLNRNELLEEVAPDVYYLAPSKYRLEPEWVTVLLAALVYSGDIGLAIVGDKFEPGIVAKLVSTPISQLVSFKHIEQPLDWPVEAMKSLFELLGLAPGNAIQVTLKKPEPVQTLQSNVEGLVGRLVLAQQYLAETPTFWGRTLLSPEEVQKLKQSLEKVKAFLESLRAFDTAAKFKNLKVSKPETDAQRPNLEALRETETLKNMSSILGEVAGYLARAEDLLPKENLWTQQLQQKKEEVIAQVGNPLKRSEADFQQATRNVLNQLKKDYMATYAGLHAKARLKVDEDKRKVSLLKDGRLDALTKLAAIDLMPANQIADLQDRLARLVPCYEFAEVQLQSSPTCPHCEYKPSSEMPGPPAVNLLKALDNELDNMVQEWTTSLLTNLEDPTVAENLDLLKPNTGKLVDDFLKSRTLPEKIDQAFVKAMTEALSGLHKVVVKADDLWKALLAGGSPATPDELARRFDEFVRSLTKMMDQSKVRIVLE